MLASPPTMSNSEPEWLEVSEEDDSEEEESDGGGDSDETDDEIDDMDLKLRRQLVEHISFLEYSVVGQASIDERRVYL
ncbi:hypothetical protein IHE45_13G071200 [Dioscorea alata]|uniref:Uncharacterized protein n=1 Tax=Dioscorea alata TaxID=55571 RepID=A0ACB7UYU3_DIOAL|nr:hypothetical protein IHE45_13G071200 [Dioscorea alata]